jgi:hypothetical protein
LSRDDINIYKKNELLYNKKGVENKNMQILSKKISTDIENNYEYKNEIIRKRVFENRKNIQNEIKSDTTETSDISESENTDSDISESTI